MCLCPCKAAHGGAKGPGPVLAACLLLALAAGCPGTRGSDLPPTDSSADAVQWGFGDGLSAESPADGPTTDSLACSSDCADFVFDRILLPTSTSQAAKWALVYNGQSYNLLGSILVQLASAIPDLQSSVDLSVYRGSTLVLLRIKAASLQSAASALGQTWLGAATTCCSSTTDLTACAGEAKQSCFAGSSTLQRKQGSPNDMVFSGSISSGALSLGPAKMKLQLSLGKSSTPATLTLEQVSLKGNVSSSSTAITSGIISGAIPQADVKSQLVPQMAAALDELYKASTTSSTVKAMLKQLFDTDVDGTISTNEVLGSSLVSTILKGDVDVDGDGSKDISLGLGFSAVSCIIL